MTLRIIFESSDFCVLFLTVMEHECNIVEFSMYCDKLVLSKPLEAMLLNIEKSQTLITVILMKHLWNVFVFVEWVIGSMVEVFSELN